MAAGNRCVTKYGRAGALTWHPTGDCTQANGYCTAPERCGTCFLFARSVLSPEYEDVLNAWVSSFFYSGSFEYVAHGMAVIFHIKRMREHASSVCMRHSVCMHTCVVVGSYRTAESCIAGRLSHLRYALESSEMMFEIHSRSLLVLYSGRASPRQRGGHVRQQIRYMRQDNYRTACTSC